MRVVFFVLSIVLIVALLAFLIFGQKFKVLLLATSKNKSAFFTLNHKLFTLVQGKVILLEDGQVSVVTKKIIQSQTEPGLENLLAKQMLKKTKLTRLDVYVDNGKVKNAFLSAIVAGTGESLAGVIRGMLETKGVETHFHFVNNLNNEDITLAVDLNIKISLLNAIIAYVQAKRKLKKEKEKKLCAKEIELKNAQPRTLG